MGSVPSGFGAVDDAVRAGAGGAFTFLERLIGARSTVGEEAPAQRIVADELARLGFDVTAVDSDPECVRLTGRYCRCHEASQPEQLQALFGFEAFDVVVGLLYIRRVKRKLSTFL